MLQDISVEEWKEAVTEFHKYKNKKDIIEEKLL
jgi:hypothetical protein